METSPDAPQQRHPVSGILLLAVAIYLSVAFIGFAGNQVGPADPLGSNPGGPAGAAVANLFIGAWGVIAFLLPLAALLVGLRIALLSGGIEHGGRRLTGLILLMIGGCGVAQMLPSAPWLLERWSQAHFGGLGGSLGHWLAGPEGVLRQTLGTIGAATICGATALAGLILLRLNLVHGLHRILRAIDTYRAERADARRDLARAQRDSSASVSAPDSTAPASAAKAAKAKAQPPAPAPARKSTPPPATSAPAAPAPLDKRAAKGHEPVDVAEMQRRLTDRQSTGDLDEAGDLVDRIRQRRRELEAARRSGSTGSDTDDGDSSAVQSAAQSPDRRSDDDSPAIGAAADAPKRTLTVAGALGADDRRASKAGSDTDESAAEDETVSPRSKPLPTPPPADPASRPKPAARPPRNTTGDYELPDMSLLEEGPEKREEESRQEIEDTAKVVERMFEDFKINVEVVKASRGPVLTLYELALRDTGMRVNKVANLEKELALNVGSEGIRIVAPLPNKKTIGVEIPNVIKDFVVMRDLIREGNPEEMELPIILGRDVLGQPMIGNLAKMPHLLVAGATGMGKSVCLNAIITSLLLFKDPDECKFILVDPKMVELAPYEDIPHLLTPPITDMTKAHAALEWACKTMDERYYMLRMVGARSMKDFNVLGGDEIERRLLKKGKRLEELPGFLTHMPYIVIIVDEYADLMMVNKDVEKSLVRLTAKARAAGIHIILTTQRPSADVVTGLIKSNLPARACFRVADKSNSRVVLDTGGAENLLGKGDMLFLDNGAPAPIRGQGVWVKDEEIDAIIELVRAQGEPEYDESICKVGAVVMTDGSHSGSAQASGWVTDREFHEAVRAVIQYGRTGADFLRRKMNVGYNKATGFIETMEELGIVGEAQGTKPRELQYSWDDWIDMLKSQGVELPEDDETYINPHAPGL